MICSLAQVGSLHIWLLGVNQCFVSLSIGDGGVLRACLSALLAGLGSFGLAVELFATTEWFELEGALKGHQVQVPAASRDTSSCSVAAGDPAKHWGQSVFAFSAGTEAGAARGTHTELLPIQH